MSQQSLGPYINFGGKAREAMAFYHKLLGGKLDLQTMTQQGALKPAGPGDRIMQARLEADGALIVATDGRPDYPARVGDHIAIALAGRDRVRLGKIFNDLADGGKIKGPLTKQSGGAEVGRLVDKFGMNWMVSIDQA